MNAHQVDIATFRLPRAYRLLEPILGLMAVIARRRNVDRMLERRDLSGTTHHS